MGSLGRILIVKTTVSWSRNTSSFSLFCNFLTDVHEFVVVQFYRWFNSYFPLFLYMVMYDNEYKAKKNIN